MAAKLRVKATGAAPGAVAVRRWLVLTHLVEPCRAPAAGCTDHAWNADDRRPGNCAADRPLRGTATSTCWHASASSADSIPPRVLPLAASRTVQLSPSSRLKPPRSRPAAGTPCAPRSPSRTWPPPSRRRRHRAACGCLQAWRRGVEQGGRRRTDWPKRRQGE